MPDFTSMITEKYFICFQFTFICFRFSHYVILFWIVRKAVYRSVNSSAPFLHLSNLINLRNRTRASFIRFILRCLCICFYYIFFLCQSIYAVCSPIRYDYVGVYKLVWVMHEHYVTSNSPITEKVINTYDYVSLERERIRMERKRA